MLRSVLRRMSLCLTFDAIHVDLEPVCGSALFIFLEPSTI
jgi:hypothetical protein